MFKRKEPELDPKEQLKRFQEAAKEHGVEDGEEAEKSFSHLASKMGSRLRPKTPKFGKTR
jgi:hypothetical protein